MLKKRTHQFWIVADFLQLLMHTILQFFAFLQRPSGYARAFRMTPHQLIRIQVWRITGQEMKRQPPLCAGHVIFDHLLLVRRQTINDQAQRFLAAIHQFLEQRHEQFAGQPALISGKPERAFGIDRRGRADALALPRPVDHRCFPLSDQVLPCTASARKPDSSQK